MKVEGEAIIETNSRIKISDSNNDFKGWGYRHQQCFILFLCLTTSYITRSCMGVALVAMVDTDSRSIGNSHNLNISISNATDQLKAESHGLFQSLLLIPPYPSFEWPKKSQDYILSSFFVGYMLLQIPAGHFAHLFGARLLLSGSLFINCFISICLPWAAFHGGWILTSICRFIQGLSQACVLPGMHTMLGKWTTSEERGRLAGFAYGGQAFGTMLGLPITGFIVSSPLGWPGVFRFFGLVSGVIAGIIWAFGADNPANHPKISDAERNYIEDNLGQKDLVDKNKLKIPWGRILRSPGMFAIIVAHISSTWGHVTLYSEVPAYMDNVMGVNIKANGVLTSLPFVIMWITNFFFSWFTDMLILKKILSVRNTRKLANTLGSVPAAIGLVALGYAPKNIYVVETILIIICAFKISCHLGFHVNHIDISNNFSGAMMAFSNSAANCVSCLAPLVAGLILTDVTSEYLWRKVFFVAAGLYFFSNVVYVVFGTAEKAEWDNPEEDQNEDREIQSMLTENHDKRNINGANKTMI